ncbi:MAG: hypothetical protein GY856_05095 [bacterium]|nr:hypothetical protein [bacterium]
MRRSRKRPLVRDPGNPDGSHALLPRHVDEGHEGLRDDLLDLGLLKRMHDGRINMPEVYRLAFGLGRRGGVKPIR